jgi:hypothetical protein
VNMNNTMTDQELAEWKLGARNAKAGLSLSKSYKHLYRYDHDMRKTHKDGWIAMKHYLMLKELDEMVDIDAESV